MSSGNDLIAYHLPRYQPVPVVVDHIFASKVDIIYVKDLTIINILRIIQNIFQVDINHINMGWKFETTSNCVENVLDLFHNTAHRMMIIM